MLEVELAERLRDMPAPSRVLPAGLHLMVLALNVARTPDVAVPETL